MVKIVKTIEENATGVEKYTGKVCVSEDGNENVLEIKFEVTKFEVMNEVTKQIEVLGHLTHSYHNIEGQLIPLDNYYFRSFQDGIGCVECALETAKFYNFKDISFTNGYLSLVKEVFRNDSQTFYPVSE